MSAHSNGDDYEDLIHRLLNCLGISEASFEEAIAWSLCEAPGHFLGGRQGCHPQNGEC
jgi:hypothetical protein